MVASCICVFFILTQGSRIFTEEVSRKQKKILWYMCSAEIDNHAYTHFFGRNIQPLSFTSEACTVSPLLVEYYEQENTTICTGETSYTMETGEVIILIFGQGLWFGNRIEKFLINPNQCQSFGILIYDEPTDQHKPLGIEADLYTHIQMSMVVSTCGFINRYPTNDDIDTC